MRRKNLKTFEEYMVDYELTKDFDTSTISKRKMNNIYRDKYSKMYFDYLLMLDVVDDNSNENVNDVVIAINKNDFENDPGRFYNSVYKSKRVEYLSPYTVDDMKDFKTYKLRGYNIGFAIKRNGDIILVHNNDNVKGIGDLLIKKAIEYGGNHLDHFDGFLTGFYKKNGFKLKNNDEFAEEYAPDDWKYETVDILNPNKSIYVNELNVLPDEFMEAKDRYVSGMPDVVYRMLK